ncbi:uncharacterized protein [Periplaneta americana]|uniref:uncharacterized protein n=1 Tax=Periplaneta americana TaxID=6978 RepID=UPI0037E740D4
MPEYSREMGAVKSNLHQENEVDRNENQQREIGDTFERLSWSPQLISPADEGDAARRQIQPLLTQFKTTYSQLNNAGRNLQQSSEDLEKAYRILSVMAVSVQDMPHQTRADVANMQEVIQQIVKCSLPQEAAHRQLLVAMNLLKSAVKDVICQVENLDV